MSVTIADAISFVFNVISSAWGWLLVWNYKGIPFGYFLLAIAIIGIILDYVF